MIVAHDCENKQLKGPFSISCSSDTQSQLLSASIGIHLSIEVYFLPCVKNNADTYTLWSVLSNDPIYQKILA